MRAIRSKIKSDSSAGTLSCVQTAAGVIKYSVFRKPYRRSLVISIRPDREIRVLAPRLLADQEIEKFILQKSQWIHRKLKEFTAQARMLEGRNYKDGSQFLFRGKNYPVTVFPDRQDDEVNITFEESAGWGVHVPAGRDLASMQTLIGAAFAKWYKNEAGELFPGRIFHFARMMQLDPQKIAVKNQRHSWGSCSIRNRSINLNWKLVMAPPAVLDYVIVHELTHLIHADHSSRFWKKVNEIVPEHEERKNWLKQHRLEMILPK